MIIFLNIISFENFYLITITVLLVQLFVRNLNVIWSLEKKVMTNVYIFLNDPRRYHTYLQHCFLSCFHVVWNISLTCSVTGLKKTQVYDRYICPLTGKNLFPHLLLNGTSVFIDSSGGTRSSIFLAWCIKRLNWAVIDVTR